MLSSIESKIFSINAKFYNADIEESYFKTSEKIFDKVFKAFPPETSIGIIAGLGGNGSDGILLAEKLLNNGYKNTHLYLVGRKQNLDYSFAIKSFERIKQNFPKNISQEVYAENIDSANVVVEAMVGTGLKGTYSYKRINDILKRISHFKTELISLDQPAPGYNPDRIISIDYPKGANSITIKSDFSDGIKNYVGPGEVNFLFIPKKSSHKNKNGKILYITQSKNEHKLKMFRSWCNSYLVEFEYWSMEEMKGSISLNELRTCALESDCLFIEKLEDNLISNAVVKELLSLNRKVFINSAFTDLVSNYKNEAIIFADQTDRLTLRDAQLNKVNILQLGFRSEIYSTNGEFKLSRGKIEGIKDYRDQLSFLTAVLFTKNEAWLSLRSAQFLLEVCSVLAKGKDELGENLMQAIVECK